VSHLQQALVAAQGELDTERRARHVEDLDADVLCKFTGNNLFNA